MADGASGEKSVQVAGIAFFRTQRLSHGFDEQAVIGQMLKPGVILPDKADDFPVRLGKLDRHGRRQKLRDGFIPVAGVEQKPVRRGMDRRSGGGFSPS